MLRGEEKPHQCFVLAGHRGEIQGAGDPMA